MNLEQINARLAEIRSLLDNGSADLDIDALTAEANRLIAERNRLMGVEQRRQELRNLVAGGAGEVIRSGIGAAAPAQPVENRGADSPEYRRAFLLNLLNRGDEMTREERAAFVHTTGNTGNVLPTTMLNQIWDNVSTEHSILGDITIYRTGTILEIVKHTAIAQGAAKSVAENTANDDEQNTFVKVALSGKDFSKTVELSYAMERMSLEALEAYLITEISDGLGAAMSADVVTTIEADMNSANKITTAAANTVTYKEIAALFGKLTKVGSLCVYATRSTIYSHLVGMVDATGRPIFQPNAQAGAEGTILGAVIRVEDAVADGKLLVGDGKTFVFNMIQDIMLEKDRDIKTHKVIHSGYARGQGALTNDKSFAELTVKSA